MAKGTIIHPSIPKETSKESNAEFRHIINAAKKHLRRALFGNLQLPCLYSFVKSKLTMV